MPGTKLVGLGLILLFGLPALIAASERRRIPNIFHFILGFTALAWWWAVNGPHGLLTSIASGILVLLISVAAVAFTQRCWNRRILSGGELRLMAAAALWLPPPFAIAAMLATLIGVVLWALKDRQNDKPARPDLAPFAIITLLVAFTLA